jgi:hypothetical protein
MKELTSRKGKALRIRIMVIVCSFLLSSLPLAMAQAAQWDPGPMPKDLRVASYDVGGGVYIITAALGEGIYKKFGVRLRSLPVGTGTSRILNVKIGNTDFGVTIDGLFASEGLYDFASLEWGPQPLRMLYISNRQSAYSIATTNKSGIKTPADLKGKRAAWLVGSPFTQLMVKGALAFAGLTLDDVTLVKTRSIGSMYETLVNGKADFSPMDSSSSTAYRLASSPKGLNWVPFSADNKQGWTRFRKINPQVAPIYCQFGAGLSENKRVWMATVPMPQYFAYANADEGNIYWIVKMIAESFDEYKDISLGKPWHKPEEAIKAYSVLPYHPGAIRYFKEKGLWNAQLEKNQGELLDRQPRLRDLWEKTVAEALEKGVKGKEYPQFWLKKKMESFPTFWSETPAGK